MSFLRVISYSVLWRWGSWDDRLSQWHTHNSCPEALERHPQGPSPGNQLWSTRCIPAKSQVREGLFAAGRCLVNELTWWPSLHDQIWSFNKRKTPMITCGILVVKNGAWFYCPTAAQCKEWNCSRKIAGNGRCDWPRFRWAEELAWTNWTLPDLDAAFPKSINSNQKLQSSRAWVTCFCFNWSNPVCFRGRFLSTLEFCSEWLLDPGFQWVAKEWKTQIPTWQSFSARQHDVRRSRRSRLEVLGSPKIAGWCSISWLVQYRSTSKLRSSVCKALGDGRFKIWSWTMEFVFPN